MEDEPQTGQKTAGYSGTSLVQKLGIKPGERLAFLGAPANYAELLGQSLPHELELAQNAEEEYDVIHFFSRSVADIDTHLPRLKKALRKNGALWLSWPKKAAGVETDLTDVIVRGLGLAIGLVDVKVCAVDSAWSGLKFVYRKGDRKGVQEKE